MNNQEEDYTIVLTPHTREVVDAYLAKMRQRHIELMEKRGKAKKVK